MNWSEERQPRMLIFLRLGMIPKRKRDYLRCSAMWRLPTGWVCWEWDSAMLGSWQGLPMKFLWFRWGDWWWTTMSPKRYQRKSLDWLSVSVRQGLHRGNFSARCSWMWVGGNDRPNTPWRQVQNIHNPQKTHLVEWMGIPVAIPTIWPLSFALTTTSSGYVWSLHVERANDPKIKLARTSPFSRFQTRNVFPPFHEDDDVVRPWIQWFPLIRFGIDEARRAARRSPWKKPYADVRKTYPFVKVHQKSFWSYRNRQLAFQRLVMGGLRIGFRPWSFL